MTLNRSLLKRTLALFLIFNLAGFACPLLIPKAHALYWEDEGDDNNNPNEVKHRPDHFNLFDWMGDMDKDAKKKQYEQMDNHDRGPDVNNGARALELVASGIVGLGAGLFLSYEFAAPNSNLSSDMFIGGAVGLGAGIGIGALIMPPDYNVDQVTQSDFLKQREAWLQDPIRLQVARAFQPSQVAVRFQF